jgi:enterochelin esterase-like enzyme
MLNFVDPYGYYLINMTRQYLYLGIVFLLAACSDTDEPTHKTVFYSFTDFIDRIETVDPEDRQMVVDEVLDTIPEFPVVEAETRVFFVYQEEANSVHLAGDINGWSPEATPMKRVPDTDLWYKEFNFEYDKTRIDYKFVVNGSTWKLDPKNPNRIPGGFGDNSELALSGYVQPWEIVPNSAIATGTIVEHEVSSSFTSATYDVHVYLPPGYSESVEYPVAYFQDGSDYLDFGSCATILDNLIDAGEIRPIIGVFVIPNDRNEEYAFGSRNSYKDFFVVNLVPFIDENYATIQNPSARAVIGDSFGGNISAIISFNHPEIFGNCGLHSGAFWPNDYEVNDLIMEGPIQDIRIATIWGQYEGSLTYNMFIVGEHLAVNGYDMYWNILPEGHSWGLWRATTDEMLAFFFPPLD